MHRHDRFQSAVLPVGYGDSYIINGCVIVSPVMAAGLLGHCVAIDTRGGIVDYGELSFSGPDDFQRAFLRHGRVIHRLEHECIGFLR